MPKTCNHDCLNCKYAECISPDLTYEELRQSDTFDKKDSAGTEEHSPHHPTGSQR